MDAITDVDEVMVMEVSSVNDGRLESRESEEEKLEIVRFIVVLLLFCCLSIFFALLGLILYFAALEFSSLY